jgi:Mrp family chromosome partitioning ATPase
MTALDQAFIRAFSQQGTLPAVPPRQSAGAPPDSRVDESGTVPLGGPPRMTSEFCGAAVPAARASEKHAPQAVLAQSLAAAVPKAEPQPSAVPFAPDVAPPHISDVFRDVLATLERTPVRPTNPERARASAPDASWNSAAEAETGPWIADWCQTSVGMAEPLDFAEPVVLAESVGLIESVDETEPRNLKSVERKESARAAHHRDTNDLVRSKDLAVTTVETPRQPKQREQQEHRVAIDNQQSAISDQQSAISDQESVVSNQPSAIDTPQSPVARFSSFPELPPTKEAIAPPDFKPTWQVERFTWPRVCRRLMARAAEEFDRLADALSAANARGQIVLAMAGCCRGEGATTLLLCAARRLAERGVKLVLVDADLSRPRLAKRLGVELQSGWNETSGEDATFLANAVVESAANNLALAAIREPTPTDHQKPGDWSRLPPCLDTLKNHYEMVLVDLGPLENIESIGDFFDRTLGAKIDAVLLVRNPRITSEARLAAVEQQLTASAVALAGLIENFVA